jgi:hypothetical protein
MIVSLCYKCVINPLDLRQISNETFLPQNIFTNPFLTPSNTAQTNPQRNISPQQKQSETIMNSNAGIQELMAAEQKASQIVAEARLGEGLKEG